MGNSQSRKWNITINNPETVGLNHKAIVEKLKLFCPRYYCLADEIATTGTPHTHIFLLSDSPIRFSTIKNRLPVAHIERAYGSAQDNRDYVRKGGKWADSDKAETVVAGTFQEWGDMPSEKAEKAPLMVQIMEDIKDGKTTAQIIEDNPALAFRVQQINTLGVLFLGVMKLRSCWTPPEEAKPIRSRLRSSRAILRRLPGKAELWGFTFSWQRNVQT